MSQYFTLPFQFPVNCNVVNCSGEALFYSRRIGRAPELTDLYGDASSPSASTILGAGKLTGRFPGGLTVGVLEAVTGRESGTEGRTIEPATNYAALRLQQDFRQGLSGVGVMVTGVNRALDQWSEAHKNPDGTPNKFTTAYKDMPREGHLGFQYHGKPVWFKNLIIKPLD